MKKELTRIAVVLDRSGSMGSVKQATIDGFNEFFNQQKQTPGEADVLFAQFDHEYEIVFDKPIKEVPVLDDKTYVPRGYTALLDAIGRTVTTLGERLHHTPEGDRPGKVIVAIITDGHENASKEYTSAQIRKMVEHQRETYKWDFVFLGANQDAVLTAKGFGISQDSALTYNANPRSVRAMSASLGSYTTATRSGERAMFSAEDRKKAKQ